MIGNGRLRGLKPRRALHDTGEEQDRQSAGASAEAVGVRQSGGAEDGLEWSYVIRGEVG